MFSPTASANPPSPHRKSAMTEATIQIAPFSSPVTAFASQLVDQQRQHGLRAAPSYSFPNEVQRASHVQSYELQTIPFAKQCPSSVSS